jgi:PAS domain S-box-containing protein
MQQNNNADLEKQLQACRTELAELAKALQTERLRRQQVEEALREAERRFRAVFEQMFQFTGLLTPEGVLLEANQTALEFGGFQLADVVSRPFWEARWWTLSPETQEQLREAISQAAAGQFVRYEVDVLGKGDRLITIDFSLKPVKDETGQVVLLVAEGRDITELKQAARQELHQQTTKILESITDAFFAVARDWRFTYVNSEAERLMQRTRDELLGQNMWDVYPAAVNTTFDREYHRAMVEQITVRVEEFCLPLNAWFDVKIYPAENGLSVYFRDITECKQAGEALYQREQEFKALADNAPDIIARIDRQLRHLYVNAAIEPVTGLSPQNFIGKTHRELGIAEAQCVSWEEHLQQVLTTGQEQIIEFDFVTPNGTTRYYQSRLVPEFGQDGSIQSLLGISRDVTDFKQTEAALRESEERFRQLAENIDAVFWMRSLDEQLNKQELLYLSPAYETIWGRTRESLYEQPDSWLDTIHPEDLPRLMALIEQQRQGEFPKREYRIVLPDGSIRWIQDRTFPIHNAEGRVYRVAGIAEDITDRKQAEAALSESEERFRQLAENIDTLFWVFSLDEQQTLYISPTYEKIWGRSSHPLYENPQYWMETIHPEDHAQAAITYERLNSGELVEDVYRIVKPDGSVRWIRDRAFPVYDSQGRLYRAAGIAEDITERKQAELALRESEERFRQLAENIDAIFWIFSLDERKLLYISPAYDKIWGRPRERLYEEATRWREGVHPEDLPAIAASAQRQLQGEFPERVYRIIRPDGSIRWLQDHTFPIYNSEGRLYRHAGIAEDITERKQAEAALQESEQKYRNLVETAQGLIWSVDSEGRFTFINQASKQFYGYEPEEMIRRKATEFTTPEQAQKDMEAQRRVLAGESLLQYETMALRKDGTPFYISANAIVLRDDAGNVLGITGTSIDITERKQADEQLQASLQEKEALLKEVHHRVKNNLQVISSLLDLQSLQIQDAIALEAFRESQNRVKSIALIHEQLYQSKNLARVNLADYIGSLTSNLLQTYSMNPNNITLQLKVDEILLELDKLIPCGLIINELVTNALKHGFPGNTKGTIWVELNSVGVESPEEKAHQYTLVVGNDGIKLQASQDLYSAKSLGLQLVNVLVQQLGGQLEITQNRGTEFKIRFSDSDDLVQI